MDDYHLRIAELKHRIQVLTVGYAEHDISGLAAEGINPHTLEVFLPVIQSSHSISSCASHCTTMLLSSVSFSTYS